MKKMIRFLLPVVSLFLLYGCQKSDENTIKVGLVAELSGVIPLVGSSAKDAAILARDEINVQGINIDGKIYKIDIVIQDSEANAGLAAKKVEKLLSREDHVLAIVGPLSSGNAIAAARVAEENKTPLLAPWSTDPKTTLDDQGNPKHYVFRTCFTDIYQGLVLGKFAHNNLKAKTAAILYDSTLDVMQGQAELFKKTFVKFGGKIVAEETYSTGNKDFSEQFNKIKMANPDIIFMPSYYSDVPLQVKQARSLGVKAVFLGSDSWASDSVLKECGKDCEGSYFADHYSADAKNAQVQKFVDAYKKRYGKMPDAVAALTYDAFELLFRALQTVDKLDRESLRNSLAKIKLYNGVTGKIRYSSHSGDPEKGAVIMQIKDGKFVWVDDIAVNI